MTQKQSSIIEVKDLTFTRGERVIYEKINLSIAKGKITAIMGPSGIGKTTLLKLMGGQLYPNLGSITFDGVNIHQCSRTHLYQIRKRMSMLFQSGSLFTDMNVFDNVAFPLVEHSGLPKEIIRKIALMKLEAVGLRGAANLMPSELSGGMQRRIALARAIALEPEVIMYDEPFAGQDPIAMGVLAQLIKDLSNALNLTSIVVSHDVHAVMDIADYIYVIADKKIIAQGSPDKLKKDQSNLQLIQFLQGMPDGPVPFHYSENDYLKELFSDNH